MFKLEFNKHEMIYLSDYIKFADAKAGVIIGINGLLIKGTIDLISPSKLYPISDFIGFLGIIILLVGISFLVSVVLPRTKFKANRGIIFWDNIVQYDKSIDYVNAVMPLDIVKINEKMTEQNYFLAKTAAKKYRLLVFGFWISVIGAFFVITRYVLEYIQ